MVIPGAIRAPQPSGGGLHGEAWPRVSSSSPPPFVRRIASAIFRSATFASQ